jgi:hypothetical protein
VNDLHDLITAIVQITAAQVGDVSAENPGDPAAARQARRVTARRWIVWR